MKLLPDGWHLTTQFERHKNRLLVFHFIMQCTKGKGTYLGTIEENPGINYYVHLRRALYIFEDYSDAVEFAATGNPNQPSRLPGWNETHDMPLSHAKQWSNRTRARALGLKRVPTRLPLPICKKVK